MSEDKTVKCSNCGATIDVHSPKCPYCGYINPEGAEEDYMKDLTQVRKDLDMVDEAAAKEYKKSLSGGIKTSVITFAVMIGLILLLMGAYILMGSIIEDSFSTESRTPEEEMAELAAEKEFFPKLDSLYEAGDHEGLVKLARSEEAQAVDLWNYKHYEFLTFYEKYIDVRDIYLPELDSGRLDKEHAARLTECVFEYYYRSYDSNMNLSGYRDDKDIAILDGIREDHMLEILHSRLMYTDEDMEAAKDDIMEGGFFHLSEAYDYSDRYFERY